MTKSLKKKLMKAARNTVIDLTTAAMIYGASVMPSLAGNVNQTYNTNSKQPTEYFQKTKTENPLSKFILYFDKTKSNPENKILYKKPFVTCYDDGGVMLKSYKPFSGPVNLNDYLESEDGTELRYKAFGNNDAVEVIKSYLNSAKGKRHTGIKGNLSPLLSNMLKYPVSKNSIKNLNEAVKDGDITQAELNKDVEDGTYVLWTSNGNPNDPDQSIPIIYQVGNGKGKIYTVENKNPMDDFIRKKNKKNDEGSASDVPKDNEQNPLYEGPQHTGIGDVPTTTDMPYSDQPTEGYGDVYVDNENKNPMDDYLRNKNNGVGDVPVVKDGGEIQDENPLTVYLEKHNKKKKNLENKVDEGGYGNNVNPLDEYIAKNDQNKGVGDKPLENKNPLGDYLNQHKDDADVEDKVADNTYEPLPTENRLKDCVENCGDKKEVQPASNENPLGNYLVKEKQIQKKIEDIKEKERKYQQIHNFTLGDNVRPVEPEVQKEPEKVAKKETKKLFNVGPEVSIDTNGAINTRAIVGCDLFGKDGLEAYLYGGYLTGLDAEERTTESEEATTMVSPTVSRINEDTITTTKNSDTSFNVGAGLSYTFENGIYVAGEVGAFLEELEETVETDSEYSYIRTSTGAPLGEIVKFNGGTIETTDENLSLEAALRAGYKIRLGKNFTIIPNVFGQYRDFTLDEENNKWSFGGAIKGELKFWNIPLLEK